MNRFLAELKRRRVIRAALVYMGAAFVVLQVADLFVEAFQLPPVVFATFGIAAIPDNRVDSGEFNLRQKGADFASLLV